MCVAEKYCITSAAMNIDSLLELSIQSKTAELNERRPHGGRRALFWKTHGEKNILDMVLWCAQFGLLKSIEACKQYIAASLSLCYQISVDGMEPKRDNGGYEIALMIRRLERMGYKDAALSLATELMSRFVLND